MTWVKISPKSQAFFPKKEKYLDSKEAIFFVEKTSSGRYEAEKISTESQKFK